MSRFVWLFCFLLAVFASGVITTTAAGAMINSQIKTGSNTLQDNDGEYDGSFIGTPPSVTSATYAPSTTLNIGSVLTSILVFNSINGGSGLSSKGVFGGDYQLTAVAQIQVVGKTFIGTAGQLGITTLPSSTSLYDFQFAAVGGGTGTTISLYEDNSATDPSFTRNGSLASAINSASQGTLLATFGFANTSGAQTTGTSATDFWTTLDAPDDVSLFSQFSTQVNGLAYSFGQSLLSNPGGITISTVGQGGGLPDSSTIQTSDSPGPPTPPTSLTYSGQYDIVATGQVFGVKGQNTNFQLYTSTQVSFDVTPVPAPPSAILVVMGFVVSGCGLFRQYRSARRTWR